MNTKGPHCCDEMNQHLESGEVAIRYIPKFREYGIPYLDGGSGTQLISFCPWCGSKLPESLRDEWFDYIETNGLEPDDPAMPKAYQTDEWWQGKK